MGRPYTSHFTDQVTPECLLVAATVVKHSLDNWAGGSLLHVVFEADKCNGMQISIADIRIGHWVGTFHDLFERWESIPPDM